MPDRFVPGRHCYDSDTCKALGFCMEADTLNRAVVDDKAGVESGVVEEQLAVSHCEHPDAVAARTDAQEYLASKTS